MKVLRSSVRVPAALLAAFLLAPASPAAAVCGDVSGDDEVTTSDALRVLRKSVGQSVPLTCDQCGDDCLGDIRYLLGTWEFESEFDVIYEDFYDLIAVDEAFCLIVGEDLNDRSVVYAGDGYEAGFDYVLLDPGDGYCDYFLFDRDGQDFVEGIDVLLDMDEDGECGEEISGIEHVMYGERIADYELAATQARAAARHSGGSASRLEADATRAKALQTPAELTPGMLASLQKLKAKMKRGR